MTEEKAKEQKITEQIQLQTELMKVTTGIKENITQDYTLAEFDKTEKEYISENYENAAYAKEIITREATTGYEYKFNDKKFDWERDNEEKPKKIPINENDKKKIQEYANKTFTMFMQKPHMLATLNRNKKQNFLVTLLGGKLTEEEKPVIYGADDRTLLQKIQDKLSGKKQEEENND